MKPVAALLLGFALGIAAMAIVQWALALDESSAAIPNVAASPVDMKRDLPLSAGRGTDLPGSSVDAVAPMALQAVERPASAGSAEPIGILVYGTVTDAEGKSDFDGSEQVEFVPETGTSLWTSINGGTYSRPGLSAGKWRVGTRIQHYNPSSQGLELTSGEPFVRLDIVLSASHSIVVRAFTPDGRPLEQALRDEAPAGANLAAVLGAVGSTDPLTEVPQLQSYEWNHWGIGHFFRQGGIGATIGHVVIPEDCLGVLELDVASSAWVHLMLGSCLLGSQPITADASEVSFTVGIAEAARCAGSVSIRCLDATTRVPLANASISFTTRDSWREPEKAGPDGRWHRDPVTPGEYLLTASTDASEHLTYKIAVKPGQAVDVGDVLLHEATTISGVVVDVAGAPVSTSVRLRCLDSEGAWPVDVENSYVGTGADGSFEFSGLGPRRYVLHVQNNDYARHPVAVSTIGGDVTGLRVVALPGQVVSLRPGWGAAVARAVQVIGEDGLIATESESLRGGNPWARRLASGQFTAVVLDGGKELRRIGFSVADQDLVVDLGP